MTHMDSRYKFEIVRLWEDRGVQKNKMKLMNWVSGV